MEKVTFSQVEIDRCTQCRGLWFDLLEHEVLKKTQGSEAIDIGDPKVGKSYRNVDNILCPVCQARMVKMVDNDQPHIWYEACSTCYGVFFDAGEFTDFKEDTLFDTIRDLFTRERK